ncbi:hypothetical protein [Azospirillum sp. TSO22-1]|uniref:hypothetical protein n=1 Tax=Azospirillum sp. TSO22-1 TaxID=716789 RepID=UPI000D62211D|nr:hypothetical protein [Azospirillum sp. TSO22-1]PWC41144.1 hypothetical protein TSO221_24060 [Azospirillum sp. TSO22-1]
MAETDTLERTAVIVCALLRELHAVVADPLAPDDVTLGILLGVAMHCDDAVGPFRAQRLMQQAPHIVLKTDAHVTGAETRRVAPVLRAFGIHLQALNAPEPAPEAVAAGE